MHSLCVCPSAALKRSGEGESRTCASEVAAVVAACGTSGAGVAGADCEGEEDQDGDVHGCVW